MSPTALFVFLLAPLIICTNGDKLSDRLWSNTEVIRKNALNSNLIQGIKKISLDPEEFGVYNVQDGLYFYNVMLRLKKAEEKTKDPSLKIFLHERVASYKRLYMSAFKKWNIVRADGLELEISTQNYVNHLDEVSKDENGYYMVAALIPCTRLWPWLGGEIGVKNGNFGVYTNWAKTNLDPDYKGYEKYEKVINDAFEKGLMEENKAMHVYSLSMNSEVAFFNSVSPTIYHRSHDEV